MAPPLMVAISVLDGKDADSDNPRILKQTQLNYNDPGARKVAERTTMWAMHNQHEVVIWKLRPGEKLAQIDSREDS
tara:strand:+ start:96 stop:323 length:228 start_codon:yes stop_codon:yes gene_type:complete